MVTQLFQPGAKPGFRKEGCSAPGEALTVYRTSTIIYLNKVAASIKGLGGFFS
jgi:hypothetical protein